MPIFLFFLDDREIGQHLERLVDSSENYYIFTNQNQTVLTNGEAASEEELLSLGHAASQTLFLLENADDWKFYVGTSPEYLKSQMLLITLVSGGFVVRRSFHWHSCSIYPVPQKL